MNKLIYLMLSVTAIFSQNLYANNIISNITGKDILKECKALNALVEKTGSSKDYGSDLKLNMSGFCYGFITGSIETEVLNSMLRAKRATKEFPEQYADLNKYSYYCLRDGVSIYQISKMFVHYLDSHPERLNESASMTLFFLLTDEFPCRK